MRSHAYALSSMLWYTVAEMTTTVAALDPYLRQELEELVTGMCKGLNDAKRLAILYALRSGSHSVSELCRAIDAPQSNTSQHLAILRDRGLVEAERQGNNVIYSLRHVEVIDAIDILRKVMTDEIARQNALREGPVGELNTRGGALGDSGARQYRR